MSQQSQAYADLTARTEEKLEHLAQQKPPSTDFLLEIPDFQQELAERAKSGEQHDPDVRARILKANFEQVQELQKRDQKDFAEVMFALTKIFEGIGQDYLVLEQPDESAEAIVRSAQASHRDALTNLTEAQELWFNWWFSRRDKAVAKAQQLITEAEQNIALARVKAKALARERLQNATLNVALQKLLYMSDQAIKILRDRLVSSLEQLAIVTKAKEETLADKAKAADAMTKYKTKLEGVEADLLREEEALTGLVNGTPEYAAKERQVSELKRQAEKIRGDHNTALTLFQTQERAAVEFHTHEMAWQKLIDNQRMWIVALTKETENRYRSFTSRLEAMKRVSDQEVAQHIGQAGAKVDQRNTEAMAQYTVASTRARVEFMEAHKGKLADLVHTNSALLEALQEFVRREGVVIEDLQQNWGNDPLKRTFGKSSDDGKREESNRSDGSIDSLLNMSGS